MAQKACQGLSSNAVGTCRDICGQQKKTCLSALADPALNGTTLQLSHGFIVCCFTTFQFPLWSIVVLPVTWVAAVSVVSRALLLLVPGLIESVVSERYHHPLYVDIECYIIYSSCGHDENAQNHCKVKPDRREACGKNNANTANEITLSWQKQRKSGPQCNCHLHHPRLGNSAS